MPRTPTDTSSSPANGTTATKARPLQQLPRLSGPARKPNRALVAVGVRVVVVCALGFATAWLRVGGRQPVLVLADSAPAGHVLAATDLRTVQLSADSVLTPVLASSEASVLGRSLAVPLVPGSLLSPADLGPSTVPPPGQAMVGLALKPGQYPPELTVGDAVEVVSSPAPSAAASSAVAPLSPQVASAMVAGLTQPPPGSAASAVITLQLQSQDAQSVAATANSGQLSLVIVSPRGNP